MPEFNVLISAAGRRVALMEIFRKALRILGINGKLLASDATELAPAFQSADRGFLVPFARDPEFAPRMLEICKQEHVKLVIPTNDHELPVYAKEKGRFSDAGTVVAISSANTIQIGRDKIATSAWLSENGFPTVWQASVDEVLKSNHEWDYPLVVKPRFGSASLGVSKVRDEAELRMATRDGEFVVQSLASGNEHTVDVLLNRNGKCLCAVPRRRLEIRAGEVSKGMTVREPTLQNLACEIAESLPGAYGVLNIQIFHNAATGELAVIEINPRFGGGYPLSWEAGAHYPVWMIQEILGKPSLANADAWRDRLVMLRYDNAVFVDKS
ncbi:MAG: ATP-grasp domain-containing protein [Pseudomonadota bacterium]